jgi:site-specific DNA recombinase
MAVDRILRNPAYKGRFLYQRAESVEPTNRVSSDPYRKRRKTGRRPRAQEEWITIPVPAIVDEDLWDATQSQLQRNAVQASRNNTRHRYLLRGLVRCPRCGGAYYGFTRGRSSGYRCLRAHRANSSTGQGCTPGALPAAPLEQVVWESVTEALRHPEVLVQEYDRRLKQAASVDRMAAERKEVTLGVRRLQAQEDRITDAYVGDAMDLARYRAEMEKLRRRREEMESTRRAIDRREHDEQDAKRGLENLERFCSQVARGVDMMTFEERQQLLRLVVERVVVEDGVARVETVFPTDGDGQLRNRRGEHANHSRGDWRYPPPINDFGR